MRPTGTGSMRSSTRAAHRESDLLAFEIAIERSPPGAVMTGYNKINGDYADGNSALIQPSRSPKPAVASSATGWAPRHRPTPATATTSTSSCLPRRGPALIPSPRSSPASARPCSASCTPCASSPRAGPTISSPCSSTARACRSKPASSSSPAPSNCRPRSLPGAPFAPTPSDALSRPREQEGPPRLAATAAARRSRRRCSSRGPAP